MSLLIKFVLLLLLLCLITTVLVLTLLKFSLGLVMALSSDARIGQRKGGGEGGVGCNK